MPSCAPCPAQAGALPKWGAAVEGDAMQRRNVFVGELKQMGIKNPEQLAVPSIRNDKAFLITVVGKWGLGLVGWGWVGA